MSFVLGESGVGYQSPTMHTELRGVEVKLCCKGFDKDGGECFGERNLLTAVLVAVLAPTVTGSADFSPREMCRARVCLWMRQMESIPIPYYRILHELSGGGEGKDSGSMEHPS